MAHIEIADGMLITERFGDRVRVQLPEGARVEISTEKDHADIAVRARGGAVVRRFRLPRAKADGS